jgi:hypothetical protein
MLLYSLHLLQLLDIGCFGPLKQVYSRQVEELIQASTNYISKLVFFYVFQEIFFISITKKTYKAVSQELTLFRTTQTRLSRN